MIDNLWAGTEFDQPPVKRPKSYVPDQLPEDTDAERSFLATCCAPGAGLSALEASIKLSPEDFVHPAHREIFIALRSLQSRDEEINLLTIKAELDRNGTLAKVGGFMSLTEVLSAEDVARPASLADIIREKSKLRELIKTGARIIESASRLGDYHEIISEASRAITRLAIDNPAEQLVTDMSDLLDDLAEGKAIATPNGGRAMSWGDPVLDDLCPIPRGEPTLVVARFGVGKTSIAVQALVATIESGLGKPLFLSLEMGREKVKARLAAHLSDVNSRVFRDGQYDTLAIQRILSRKEILSKMRVMFPNQQCRVEDIESLVRHAVEVHGCDCVILDQFSHVKPPRGADRENYAIANALLSQSLTALAKNLNLGWMTLAQLNRDGEDSRKPGKRDLAGTDRLGQDAAVILGLWNKGNDEKQDIWATIVKNRDDGHTGWAKPLETDHGTCRFRVQEFETFTPKTRF